MTRQEEPDRAQHGEACGQVMGTSGGPPASSILVRHTNLTMQSHWSGNDEDYTEGAEEKEEEEEEEEGGGGRRRLRQRRRRRKRRKEEEKEQEK